jgi:hypothetical protein
MPEQIKLDRSIYGYDKLIKEVYKGMKVVLLGDSRGYVSSSFNPGEEVTIIRFREPFKGEIQAT